MQVIENKENFSGSRLCVSATGSAFMDGFVLTSQGFIFLLAQSVFQFSALELGLVATAYVLGSFIGSMGFAKSPTFTEGRFFSELFPGSLQLYRLPNSLISVP